MPQQEQSPQALHRLADSFRVIGNNKVRLTSWEQATQTQEDYWLPSDMTTGRIQIASMDSPLLRRLRIPFTRHLGAYAHKRRVWDSTIVLKLSAPRDYISPTPDSALDPLTPAVLPKKSHVIPKSIVDPYGMNVAFYEEEMQEYDVALLHNRRVSSDEFLFEEEIISPYNYPKNNIGDGIKLLTAMQKHIRSKGIPTGDLA